MGVVFKARQKSLDRIVALKMLRFGEYSATEERVRFHSEAQALARLQHPHVVQIYEVGETAGQPFLCVEFVDGQSLADHLDGTPVPPQQAASLLGELARAMHYAHEKGIIHRDLKPSNILLQLDHAEKRQGDKAKRGPVSVSDHPVSLSDLRPKITDFGVAKRLDTQGDTRSGAVLGTPSYMAPEQADGATAMIDRRTDVYGLGAILYELLTGRPPSVRNRRCTPSSRSWKPSRPVRGCSTRRCRGTSKRFACSACGKNHRTVMLRRQHWPTI